MRRKPLIERKALLQELLEKTSERFYFCEYADLDGAEVWEHAHLIQAEGIISKRADSPYRSGRTNDWIKVPCQYRETFYVVGYAREEDDRFDGLYLARRENHQLIYAGKLERSGGKLDEIEPMMRKLDAIVIDRPPLKMDIDKPKARWVRPLKARVMHRGGQPPRPVRHGIFEGWDETPEAPVILDRIRAFIAQSKARKPIAAPAVVRGVPAGNIMRALDGDCGDKESWCDRCPTDGLRGRRHHKVGETSPKQGMRRRTRAGNGVGSGFIQPPSG